MKTNISPQVIEGVKYLTLVAVAENYKENGEFKMKEINNANQKLLTETDTADYFGWSVFTMREIRKRGEISHLVFNKTVRYSLAQLETYKNEHLRGDKINERIV